MNEPHLLYLFGISILGACLGSFATALGYRLPRGESILSGGSAKRPRRSKCPVCDAPLTVRDLVPVFSWLVAGGKCRHCNVPVSARYPLMEVGTMLLCVLFFLRFGLIWQTAFLIMLAPVLVALMDIDFRLTILPDSLNAILFVSGLVLAAGAGVAQGNIPGVLGSAMTAAIIYGLFSFILRAVFMKVMGRDPLGLGDVKFFAVAGVWLGLQAFPVFLIISGASGVILSLIWTRKTGSREFPFGPSLILAFLICLLLEQTIALPASDYWKNFL